MDSRTNTVVVAIAMMVLGPIASPVGAQAVPSAPRLDDGYTLFELHDIEESERGARVWRGYWVTAHYRIFGAVPDGTAVLTVFKQRGREVGRVRCEGSRHDVSDDPAWVGMTFECQDAEQRIRVVGELTAEATLIDGQTDVETPLRTHTLNVREVAQLDASPTHYVSRHQELLSAWISWHTVGGSYSVHGYFDGVSVPSNVATMSLILSVAGDSDTISAIEGSRFRCTRDGQPVTLPDGDTISDARGARAVGLNQTLRTPDGIEQKSMYFSQLALRLPFTFGPDAPSSAVNLSENPGRWQCDLRNNGQVLRTFAFTAGPGGLPVPHPEQASGLYLGPRAAMVDVTVPAAGARNERSAPGEVQAGGFHGRAWTTAALRTAAAGVPALGAPHLSAGGATAAPASPSAAPAPARPRRRR